MTRRTVIAAYDDTCGLCGDEIVADVDEIEFSIDGEWCHARCVEEERQLERTPDP